MPVNALATRPPANTRRPIVRYLLQGGFWQPSDSRVSFSEDSARMVGRQQEKQQPDEPLSQFAQHRLKHSRERPGSADADDQDVFAFTESSCLVHLVLWVKLSLCRTSRGSRCPHVEVGIVEAPFCLLSVH